MAVADHIAQRKQRLGCCREAEVAEVAEEAAAATNQNFVEAFIHSSATTLEASKRASRAKNQLPHIRTQQQQQRLFRKYLLFQNKVLFNSIKLAKMA